MRRAFAFLSLIIFAVSLAPCTDCYGEDVINDQELTAQAPVEDTHADDVEECSPFCCACCNFTISQKAFNVDLAYSANSAYFSSVLLSEPVKHSRKIWQPPRA
ncbi:hypothetical protein [uncultured Roseivirga sp.]|uniref:hypothetical protein n=1 Tax=uncultured Roseivirga sp. TaxID=543088 RepID=UPI000D7A9EF5|nr:hypothetical protein [uncultured Roseivirga sp.]PWL29675.1 MAG: hypothetical protein DCO95_07450 [Roseivirga sp. XM-24bin3]